MLEIPQTILEDLKKVVPDIQILNYNNNKILVIGNTQNINVDDILKPTANYKRLVADCVHWTYNQIQTNKATGKFVTTSPFMHMIPAKKVGSTFFAYDDIGHYNQNGSFDHVAFVGNENMVAKNVSLFFDLANFGYGKKFIYKEGLT